MARDDYEEAAKQMLLLMELRERGNNGGDHGVEDDPSVPPLASLEASLSSAEGELRSWREHFHRTIGRDPAYREITPVTVRGPISGRTMPPPPPPPPVPGAAKPMGKLPPPPGSHLLPGRPSSRLGLELELRLGLRFGSPPCGAMARSHTATR